jgi:NADH-quinone oxidoreductase subunit G
MVRLTIDGRQVSVPAGTLVIRAAEALGIEIPRFCDHPMLDPLGACRQCMVEIEGQKKLATSCTTPVAPDMVVRTQNTSEEARKAQESMLEFLLINHPLDCPVCDRGGECPLQDQTLAFGPGESRYIDPKRVYEKPLPLSPLVLLDRERCVLCARCTRFCDEISGERFIELFDRGPGERVSIAAGEEFASPFSGNTVQICPVGALTSSTYRFAARPFDVKSEDSVCPHCACGCNIRVDVRRGEVVRHLARDNEEVNDAWLCDKGRYAFRFPDRDRLTTPLLRLPGLAPASFQEVFRAIADRARGGRVAFLGGGRLTDEDNFAMSKLARTVFGTNDIDHRLAGSSQIAGDAERIGATPGVHLSYRDVEAAKAILIVGLDSREELPILHLRVRKAVRKSGARVFVLHPRRTALADVAEHLFCLPGEEATILQRLSTTRASKTGVGGVARALIEAGEQAVVLAGPRLGEIDGGVEAAAALAAKVEGRFAYLPRRAGDRGALRAGVHPGLLPGGRRIEDDADGLQKAIRRSLQTASPEPSDQGAIGGGWGSLPSRQGLDTRGILEAASRREVDVLFLVGVDPLADFPDANLARQALANARFRVVQDIALGDYELYADAVLPAAAFLEKDGHFTDWEGRGQRLRPVRNPPGLARPDWQIFQELSEVMDADMGFHSLEALHDEMGQLLAPRDGEPLGPPSSDPRARPSPSESTSSSGPPGSASETLALFTYPLLVDDGRLSVDADELKAALGETPFLEVHPDDATRLGLTDGERAVVRTEAGEAELPVRVTDAVAPGSAFVPYNQPGFRANQLLSGRFFTEATLEPAGQREPVAAEEAS